MSITSLQGKIVFIAGASSGIGASLAREYAEHGCHLILAARRLERLEELASRVMRPGLKVQVYACDVTKDGDLERVLQMAHSSIGKPDIVIANAGFGVVGNVDALSVDDFRRQLETNFYGVLRTVHATLPDLKQTKGCLALVGSVNGYIALPGNSAYAVSKFAVRALALSLRGELAPFGISVTHIAPGFVKSEIRQVDNKGVHQPNARDVVPTWLQMESNVAARGIVRGVAKRKAEVVITAHGKVIVWLQRHVPWVVTQLIQRFGVTARPQP